MGVKTGCIKKDARVFMEYEPILSKDQLTGRKIFFIKKKIYKKKVTSSPIRTVLLKCFGIPPKDTRTIKIKEIICYEPVLFYSKIGTLFNHEVITIDWEASYD